MRRVSRVACLLLTAHLLAATSAVRAGQGAAAAGPAIWTGVYTDAQANRGRLFFSGHCAECHGENLQGGEGAPLSGERFWNDWGQRTIDELLSYVRTNMPFSEDGSLKGTLPPSTYVDIVTHILRENGFPAGTRELTADSAAGMQIVSRDGGSAELPATTLAQVVGCLAPRGADGSWRVVQATAPRRVSTAATQALDATLGTRQFALKFVLRNLTAMVGHRVAVTGLLLGAGGAEGINVNTVDSLSPTCT
jgi:quinoprotein glucose dehydrogenase